MLRAQIGMEKLSFEDGTESADGVVDSRRMMGAPDMGRGDWRRPAPTHAPVFRP